jgi:hypothetical protein
LQPVYEASTAGNRISANLALLGAETRLLGPDDYAAYLKNQNKLFSGGIKALNPGL